MLVIISWEDSLISINSFLSNLMVHPNSPKGSSVTHHLPDSESVLADSYSLIRVEAFFFLNRSYSSFFTFCHPAYLTYMQSTSCEMPGWMRHKVQSRLPGALREEPTLQKEETIKAQLRTV